MRNGVTVVYLFNWFIVKAFFSVTVTLAFRRDVLRINLMPTIARTIGGPGAGKTTRALDLMEKILASEVADPMRIGFVSFTRAARREAAARAAHKFNVPLAELEKSGWFRTLHSVAYRCLGIQPGELLAGSEEDNLWLKNILGDERAKIVGGDNDDVFSMPSDAGDSCRALAMWDAARNRQIPMETLWEAAYDSDSRTPGLSTCQAVVTVYEAAKREGGRFDFCDLLMRYAGKRWSGNHSAPFDDVEPEGDDPHLPVFMHDEAQDASLLTSLVFNRLTRFSQWVYLFLDEFQSIYEFAGADGKLFGRCHAAREEILPISYRCPSNILACADAVMLKGGHAPRPFRSKDEGGDVIRTDLEDAVASVRADQQTLVLARTNEYARHAANLLDDRGIPWIPTKGGGGFNAPARAAGVAALVALRKGHGIDGEQVHRIMELLPVNADGTALFERGAKSHYADKEQRAGAHKISPLTLEFCADAGMTRAFRELVASGRYVELLEKPAARMAAAAERHGIESVLNPKVRVGTCHSAKGAQAEHVVAINRLPYPTVKSVQTEEGMQQERRVWFVTASRASRKLTIAGGVGEEFADL